MLFVSRKVKISMMRLKACIEFSSLFYGYLFNLEEKNGECTICWAFEKAKKDIMYK